MLWGGEEEQNGEGKADGDKEVGWAGGEHEMRGKGRRGHRVWVVWVGGGEGVSEMNEVGEKEGFEGVRRVRDSPLSPCSLSPSFTLCHCQLERNPAHK